MDYVSNEKKPFMKSLFVKKIQRIWQRNGKSYDRSKPCSSYLVIGDGTFSNLTIPRAWTGSTLKAWPRDRKVMGEFPATYFFCHKKIW